MFHNFSIHNVHAYAIDNFCLYLHVQINPKIDV